jgi:preprotein translocase subunit YajC
MTDWDLGFGIRDVGIPGLLAMGTPPAGTAPSAWQTLIPFVLILGIFYVIILLPMKKRQQKVQAFLSALKVNDRVITSGGIFGTITRLNEQSVQLQIASNVRIEVSRAAIVGYQGQEPVADGISQGNQ